LRIYFGVNPNLEVIMNQYDTGNNWNLDNESGFSKMLKAAASIIAVAFIFGFLFFFFLAIG